LICGQPAQVAIDNHWGAWIRITNVSPVERVLEQRSPVRRIEECTDLFEIENENQFVGFGKREDNLRITVEEKNSVNDKAKIECGEPDRSQFQDLFYHFTENF